MPEPQTVKFIGLDETTTKEAPKNFSNTVASTQYVSGGYINNRILQLNSDTLTKNFGDAIIARMLRDPEVKKCETVLKISVLNEGVTFSPAISKPAAPKVLAAGEVETLDQKRERLARETQIKRYNLAEKYANFAARAFDNLDTPIRTIMESMLDSLSYGNKVAEQTFIEKYDSDFGRNLFTLASVRVKPRKDIQFVLDKFGKTIGIQAQVNTSEGLKTQILPREKFWVLTFRGVDGDPRGSSILECVYNAWQLKMKMWPEYQRWLMECALPSLVGTTSAEVDSRTVMRDNAGNIIRDENNQPIYESDVNALLAAMVSLQNNSAIALPPGADVKPISNQVSGDPFKGMRDVLNEEIEMGMLLQTLATSEGRNMSRAAAQTHMSVLDLFVFFIKDLVIDMLKNDFLKILFNLNFENFDMTLLPIISLGDSERRDWDADVIAIATLYKSGFIGESQKVGYDQVIGAPPRDSQSDKQAADEAAAAALAAKTANTSSAANTTNSSKPKPKPAPANATTSLEAMKKLKDMVLSYEHLNGEIV